MVEKGWVKCSISIQARFDFRITHQKVLSNKMKKDTAQTLKLKEKEKEKEIQILNNNIESGLVQRS